MNLSKNGGKQLGNCVERFDFDLFCRMVKRIYPDSGCSYSVEDALLVFRYFFQRFERHTGKPHPPISKANAARIMARMPELENGMPLEPDMYIDLIEQYFETDFPDCDYRINHFFSGRIRDNRFYEALY